MMTYRFLLLILLPCFVFAQEIPPGMLLQSDFETDAGAWELVLTGKAEAETQLKDGANCVTIADGGRDTFGVQLQQAGFGLVEGETYQLSFDAYASNERAARIKVGQAASPFTSFWSQDVTLTSEAQTFSYSFVMANPDEAAAKLTLFMGGASDAPVEVCFDNISLAEGDIAVGTNLLKNGDFAADAEGWVFDAGNTKAEGSVVEGEYCAAINNAGENPWDIGLRQAELNLQTGKRYNLTVDAYADQEMTLGVKLGRATEPYDEYFFQDQTLTTQKTTYNFETELASSDPNGQLELFMGGTNTPTVPSKVCVDNFLLQEIVMDTSERVIPYLMVDQFGYRPKDTKVAVLVDPQTGFNAEDSYEPSGMIEVRSVADDSVVFSGEITLWNNGQVQTNSGDKGWWFDFSSVTALGSYYLIDSENDVRSYTFEIAEDVYKDVLDAALKTFYYNRANIAKEEPYADPRWTDGESYLGKGQDTEVHFVEDKTNEALVKDLSGGWFDAGDPNKYVTFAMAPVHVLLTAYEQNPQSFDDNLNIPESGNGIPDILDEVIWELDWLKKMQVEDGGVIIKMGDIDYSAPSPFSADTGARFYGPVCSSSSIAAASMFAHAALVLREFSELGDYANDLQARALRAYAWYKSNPKRDDCDNGEIKAGDADDSVIAQEGNKVVAAVYLLALTGDEKYNQDFEGAYQVARPFNDGAEPRWSVYDPEEGDALLYYTRLEQAKPKLVNNILTAKLAEGLSVADDLYTFDDKDLYRAFMRDESYHWGSNYPRANYGNTNLDMLHYNLGTAPGKYQERAQGMLNYFHGVNPFNMVYLSNMYELGAEYSANEIYHGWFNDGTEWDNALTSKRGPAPGYVPGGPNQFYSGQSTPPLGEPAQKAYQDWNSSEQASWEITEPAIYYQAAYVRLVANFVEK